MATSDNVVRAGLTPKFKDVDTLVDMLDYTPRSREDNIMSHSTAEDDSNIAIFQPPVPDFAVHRIQVCILLCTIPKMRRWDYLVPGVWIQLNYLMTWQSQREGVEGVGMALA